MSVQYTKYRIVKCRRTHGFSRFVPNCPLWCLLAPDNQLIVCKDFYYALKMFNYERTKYLHTV